MMPLTTISLAWFSASAMPWIVFRNNLMMPKSFFGDMNLLLWEKVATFPTGITPLFVISEFFAFGIRKRMGSWFFLEGALG